MVTLIVNALLQAHSEVPFFKRSDWGGAKHTSKRSSDLRYALDFLVECLFQVNQVSWGTFKTSALKSPNDKSQNQILLDYIR